MRDHCENITFLTFKGCRASDLRDMGFSVKEVIGFVTGMERGLVNMDNVSKSVKYLIDNEVHEDSPNQMLVG